MFGDARVSGDAQVFGDAWEVSPLQIQGTRHFVVVCAYGKLAIGCMEHEIAWWKEHYRGVGRSEGYTKAQIAEYRNYIELASCLDENSQSRGDNQMKTVTVAQLIDYLGQFEVGTTVMDGEDRPYNADNFVDLSVALDALSDPESIYAAN